MVKLALVHPEGVLVAIFEARFYHKNSKLATSGFTEACLSCLVFRAEPAVAEGLVDDDLLVIAAVGGKIKLFTVVDVGFDQTIRIGRGGSAERGIDALF